MKKNYSVFKSILCTMLATFTLLPICANAAGTPSDWALTEITAAESKNLVTEKTTVDYQKNITREEFCELIMKLYAELTNEDIPLSAISPFTDTNNEYVSAAFTYGIVTGVSDTEFAPEKNITRQELCKMILCALTAAEISFSLDSETPLSFADSDSIADWATTSVSFAYNNGIIKGIGDNKLDPLGTTTCEQAIIMIYRAFEKFNTK